MPLQVPYYQPQIATPDPARADFPHIHDIELTSGIHGDLGQSLAAVEGAYQRSEEEQARAWATDVLSDAKLKWTSEMQMRKDKAEPGASGFTPAILKDFDEYAGQLVDKSPSLRARKYLTTRLNDFRSNIGEHAIAFEAQARIDYRIGAYNNAIDNTAKLMYTDPEQFKTSLAEVMAGINEAAIPPVRKAELAKNAVETVATASVLSRIQKSPGAFLEAIGFGAAVDPQTGERTRKSSGDLSGQTGDSAFDALPAAKRYQLFSMAIQQKAQLDSDVERGTEKARRANEQEAEKSGWAMWGDGKLSRNAIENLRPALSAASYASFIRLLEKPEAGQKSDPNVFRSIVQLEANGQYGDAVNAALIAHRNGNLSNTDLQGIVSRDRTVERQEGPKSPYERSRSYIVNAMDPGPLVHDPLGKSRFAEAVSEFDGWFMAKPNRTVDEIDKRAKEIVGEYKMVDLRDTILALPKPRAADITRQTGDLGKLQREIANATNATQAKYESGNFSEPEYIHEMSNLNRWRKAVQQQSVRR